MDGPRRSPLGVWPGGPEHCVEPRGARTRYVVPHGHDTGHPRRRHRLAGSELARGIAASTDLELVGAVSRSHAGKRLSQVLGERRLDCPISGSVAEVLQTPCDVFFEYTRPEVA